MVLDIADYHNLHRGEPVALLGNGPSLLSHNLKELPMRAVGMHRSWRILPTEYHIILIHREYFDDISAGLWEPGIIFVQNHYSDYNPKAPHWKSPSRAWHPLRHHENTVLVPNNRVGKMSGRISFDLAKDGSKVIHCGLFTLEVLMWMGFNPIYLIGVDLKHDEGHFYSEKEGYSCPVPDKRDKQVWLWTEGARHIAAARPDLKIYNANPRSALTCFETRSPFDGK